MTLRLPHLRADPRDLILDDRRRRSTSARSRTPLRESASRISLAVGRVHDLGVELDAVYAALDVLDRRDGRGARRRQRREPGRRREHGVAVGHPAASARAACRAAASRARATVQLASGRTRRPRRPRRARRARAPAAACRNRCPSPARPARAARGPAAARRPRTRRPARRRGSGRGACGARSPRADVVREQLARTRRTRAPGGRSAGSTGRRSRGRRPLRRPRHVPSPLGRHVRARLVARVLGADAG